MLPTIKNYDEGRIEAISDYNMVHEMCNILQTQGARANDRAEGFGQNKDIKELDTIALLPGISTFQTVCFKPLCGLFMQTKYMPLRYCPLEIELELADVTEPIISAPFAPFTAANTSYIWKLENCMMKVDLCTLDNALDNNYVSHLLSGKLPLTSYIIHSSVASKPFFQATLRLTSHGL